MYPMFDRTHVYILDCLPATIPDDGSILSDNGETVHYECNVNYSMNGNSIRECDTNGSGWNGQDPTCGMYKIMMYDRLNTSNLRDVIR